MRLILRRGLVATRNTRKPNSFMHSVSARFIIGRRFRVSRKHSLSLSLSLSNSRQRRDNENRDRLGKIKMRKKEGKKERKKGREKKIPILDKIPRFPPVFESTPFNADSAREVVFLCLARKFMTHRECDSIYSPLPLLSLPPLPPPRYQLTHCLKLYCIKGGRN